MPNEWIERARNKRSTGPTSGLIPRLRCSRSEATTTDPDIHPPQPTICTIEWRAPLVLVASRPMAKAKRRRIRARRKKANHGRRPNAGRGKS